MIVLYMYINFLFKYYHCQQFELNNNQDRISRGKKQYEKFNELTSSQHTPCWKEALSSVDSTCRGMNDAEQSYLALQFANCHLQKSGLQTYPCKKEKFKQCTQKMGSNIIAFQSYTEFFTHVSDICFYLQSDIWRETTEDTIDKLTKTSSDSLKALSKSVKQQQEVLFAQEQSLRNQKDMLVNEKVLKEALLTSAESAKDVFNEVRDHAQQQKTMFSETFENIFESVERLASLQKMLLGEFIGLQSVAFYFVATIVCYLFTSTPRTASARLALFVALTLLITSERVFVGWRVNNKSYPDLTSEDIHDRIWFLRKIFLLTATILLGIFIVRYKDFNKINYNMLQDIQSQIIELRKLQEFQQTSATKTEQSSTDGTNDVTLIDNNIEQATKQLELSLQQAFATSTPHKFNQNDIFVFNNGPSMAAMHKPPEDHTRNKVKSRVEYSDEDDVGKICHMSKSKENKSRRSNAKNNNTSLNESKYNLRSRRYGASFSNQSKVNTTQIKNITHVKKVNKVKPNEKKVLTRGNSKPAFFSSDDEY